jgi:hypothetical protein
MKLRTLAHARSGDKGSTVNVSLIAFHEHDYPSLVRQVTAARVRAHFADILTGDVIRYELPTIAALNFVLNGVRGGGVTRTLSLDTHGKALSSSLLDMELPDEDL